MKSVTPHFVYICDFTNSSPFNGTIFRKEIENFQATVLKVYMIVISVQQTHLRRFQFFHSTKFTKGAHAMWLPTCYRFSHINFLSFSKIENL